MVVNVLADQRDINEAEVYCEVCLANRVNNRVVIEKKKSYLEGQLMCQNASYKVGHVPWS